MSEINEVIQESVEHASESKINAKVAIFVAITATFMAICNVKGGNVVQAMSQVQAHSIDAWAYFQAKSTKQTIAENSLEIIKSEHKLGNQELIRKFEEKISKYEKEKNEIKAQAEGFQKEYEEINIFDDQFDMTEALMSIAIALFGITALTQRKWLLYFASGVSLTGFIFGLAAFMHISLHSDLVAKILG